MSRLVSAFIFTCENRASGRERPILSFRRIRSGEQQSCFATPILEEWLSVIFKASDPTVFMNCTLAETIEIFFTVRDGDSDDMQVLKIEWAGSFPN